MVWSPQPAPRAASVLQGEVGNYIGAPSDTTLAAVILAALNDGIRMLNARRWPWLRTSENITLVASTADYELATTATKNVYSVERLDANNLAAGHLTYRMPQLFLKEFPNRSQVGVPTHYTAFNIIADGRISLSAPPSSAFVAQYPKLQARLYKRLTYFTTASDTMTTLGGFAPEAESFVEWHAKALVTADTMPEKFGLARGFEQSMWADLTRNANEDDSADFD